MKKEFTVIVEQYDEGYFVAEVPGLTGCHTQAKSLDVLMERVKEAIALCLDVQKKTFLKHIWWVSRGWKSPDEQIPGIDGKRDPSQCL